MSNWSPSPTGTDRAFRSVSRAAVSHRLKPRFQRLADRDDFLGGIKEAEEPDDE